MLFLLLPHRREDSVLIPYSGVCKTWVFPTAASRAVSHMDRTVPSKPAIRSHLNDSDLNDRTVIRWLCLLNYSQEEGVRIISVPSVLCDPGQVTVLLQLCQQEDRNAKLSSARALHQLGAIMTDC